MTTLNYKHIYSVLQIYLFQTKAQLRKMATSAPAHTSKSNYHTQNIVFEQFSGQMKSDLICQGLDTMPLIRTE